MIDKPQLYSSKQDLPQGAKIVEAYESAVKELFFIENPSFKKSDPETADALQKFLAKKSVKETWIYFPWRHTAVHTVPEEEYFILRTARNRNIITYEEQLNFRNFKVGIAGLSVGSAVVQALTISGGAKYIRIADFDNLEITNLNRIRGTILDIGNNKTEIAAKQIWETDPYAVIQTWPEGLTKDNISQFLSEPDKLNVFVDEMDSIDLKIYSRILAKQLRIPVVMATDNGNGIILDIERFDLEPERELFHGLIGEISWESAQDLPYSQWLRLATKIVGPEYLTERMQESLLEIGKSIASVPQLGATASLAGAAIAYAIRKIASSNELPSGRYTLGLEAILDSGYDSAEAISQRQLKTQEFLKRFLTKQS